MRPRRYFHIARIALGLLLAAFVGCGGDDDGASVGANVEDFCDGLVELSEEIAGEEDVVAVLSDPEDRKRLVDELRGLEPPEAIADEWNEVTDVIDNAEDIRAEGLDADDPRRRAFEDFVRFVNDECDVA